VWFVWLFTARRAQTPAAPWCGEGLGTLSCEQPLKSRRRDPSRPAPEAPPFPILGEALLRDLGYIKKLSIETQVYGGINKRVHMGPRSWDAAAGAQQGARIAG